MLLVCAIAGLVTLTLPHASAWALTPEEQRAVHASITEANGHWSAGRYEEALPLYQAAYEKTKFPDLLYRIAQIQEKLGRPKIAASA